ncbi:DUF6448 family protein [Streptomyces bungoensis]
MPPHCDSLDGPVVTAAREALEKGDVDLVLPYVREQGEESGGRWRIAIGGPWRARSMPLTG